MRKKTELISNPREAALLLSPSDSWAVMHYRWIQLALTKPMTWALLKSMAPRAGSCMQDREGKQECGSGKGQPIKLLCSSGSKVSQKETKGLWAAMLLPVFEISLYPKTTPHRFEPSFTMTGQNQHKIVVPYCIGLSYVKLCYLSQVEDA